MKEKQNISSSTLKCNECNAMFGKILKIDYQVLVMLDCAFIAIARGSIGPKLERQLLDFFRT